MKTRFLTTVLVPLMLVCVGTSSAEERIHNLPFDRIEAGVATQVILIPDNVYHVEVKGSKEDVRDTYSELVSGKVKVFVKRDKEIRRDYNAVVEIHYKGQLREIEAHSAAEIRSMGATVKAGNLEIKASSAAKIELDVKCDELNLDVSSAADVTLTGTAKNIDVDCSSAATADLQNLKVDTADIDVSSTGKVTVNANTIDADVSSVGTLRYVGSPNFSKLETSTGGSVKQL